MKSSKIVVKSLEITTQKPGPDRLVEYHIEPLTSNKKAAEFRQPLANTDFLTNPEHLLRNPKSGPHHSLFVNGFLLWFILYLERVFLTLINIERKIIK